MCEFCEKIAINDEEFGKIRIEKKKTDFIFVSDNKYNIFTDTGDSFCPGIVEDIRFCPNCGRDLLIQTNLKIMGSDFEWKI